MLFHGYFELCYEYDENYEIDEVNDEVLDDDLGDFDDEVFDDDEVLEGGKIFILIL